MLILQVPVIIVSFFDSLQWSGSRIHSKSAFQAPVLPVKKSEASTFGRLRPSAPGQTLRKNQLFPLRRPGFRGVKEGQQETNTERYSSSGAFAPSVYIFFSLLFFPLLWGLICKSSGVFSKETGVFFEFIERKAIFLRTLGCTSFLLFSSSSQYSLIMLMESRYSRPVNTCAGYRQM